VLTGRFVEGGWAPFRAFAEVIASYGEQLSPRQLRADLGMAGPALARIAPRLCELLPDLAALPYEVRFRLLAAAQVRVLAYPRHPRPLVPHPQLPRLRHGPRTQRTRRHQLSVGRQTMVLDPKSAIAST
jgi:hypothetical protein